MKETGKKQKKIVSKQEKKCWHDALCSLRLAMVEVGAKLLIPRIKGGLVLINMATMT